MNQNTPQDPPPHNQDLIQPQGEPPFSKRETPHDKESLDPLGASPPAQKKSFKERSLAFLFLLLDEKVMEEEEIQEILKSLQPTDQEDPFKTEQFFLKERLLSTDQYLKIQQRLNSSSCGCARCEETTYFFGKEAPSEPLCTSCLLLHKSNPSVSVDRVLLARRMELIETFFTPPKTGLIGQTWEGYKIIEELGRGGMGIVYKAFQIQLGRMVALKIIREGPSSSRKRIQRFLREARALASLRHPHIVSIHDISSFHDQYYFTMEFISGQPLSELIRQEELSIARGARIVRDVGYALAYAHSQSIVHRDLKPPNVMISLDGKPVVMDFGLAKILEDSDEEKLTKTGAVLGTPMYMAPEQITGQFGPVDCQTDVYALGAILYEVLTGRPPFLARSNVEVYKKILQDEPLDLRRFNPAISRDLDTICRKALEKDKKNRYATAEELSADLERFLQGDSILARRATLAERAYRKMVKHPWVTLVTSLFLLAVLFIGYWKWTQPGYIKTFSLKQGDRMLINGEEISCEISDKGRFKIPLRAGSYALRLERKDYFPLVERLEVFRGESTGFSPQWKSRYGTLKIFSLQGDEKLYNNGQRIFYRYDKKRRMATLRMILGMHKLSLRREKYYPDKRQVKIRSARETILSPKFMRRRGFLTITSLPYQINITLKSPSQAPLHLTTPLLKRPIPTGSYTLTFARENYLSQQRKIHLTDGQKRILFISLTPMLKWKKNTLSPLSKLLHLQDFNGDGYLDLSYYHRRRIAFLDGRTLKNLEPLRSARTILPKKFEQSKYLKKIRLGQTSFIAPMEISGYPRLRVRTKGLQKSYILTYKGRVVFFDHRGFYVKSFFASFSQNTTSVAGKVAIYFYTQRGIYKYALAAAGGQKKYRKIGNSYILSCYKEGKLLPWSMEVTTQSLRKFPSHSMEKQKVIYLVMDRYLLAFNQKNRKLIWVYEGKDSLIWEKIVQMDFNGDGLPDFGFQQEGRLVWVSGRTGTVLWNQKSPFRPESKLIGADLTGDSVPEIVGFDGENNLVAWTAKGKALWKFSAPLSVHYQALAGADANRDGVPDFVFSQGNQLICLSGKDGTVLSRYLCPSLIQGSPLLGDIDGDGFMEALFFTNKGLYCIQLYRPRDSWWQTLEGQLQFVAEQGDQLEFFSQKNLLRFSKTSGRLLSTTPFLQDGGLFLAKISDQFPGGYLVYGNRHFRLLDKRGKEIWKVKFVLPYRVVHLEKIKKNVLRVTFQDRKSSDLRYGYMYIHPWGIHWNVLFFFPSLDNQKLCLVKIAPFSPVIWKVKMANPCLWRPLNQWIPVISNHFLYVPARKRRFTRIDLASMTVDDYRVFHFETRVFLREFGFIGQGKERTFYAKVGKSVYMLNSANQILWVKNLQSYTSYCYLSKDMNLIENDKKQFIFPLHTGRGKSAILFSFSFGGERRILEQRRGFLYVFQSQSGKMLWASSLKEPLIHRPYIVDLDGDGEDEIILLMPRRIEILSGKTGLIKWTYPLSFPSILKIFPSRGSKRAHILVKAESYLHYLPILFDGTEPWPTPLKSAITSKIRPHKRGLERVIFATQLCDFYRKAQNSTIPDRLFKINKLERLFPQNLILQKRKAFLYMQTNQTAKAFAILNRLYRFYPTNRDLPGLLANVHFQLGNYYKAYFYIESLFHFSRGFGRGSKTTVKKKSYRRTMVTYLKNLREKVLKKIILLEKERLVNRASPKTRGGKRPVKPARKPQYNNYYLKRCTSFLRIIQYYWKTKKIGKAKKSFQKAKRYYKKGLTRPYDQENATNLQKRLNQWEQRLKKQ